MPTAYKKLCLLCFIKNAGFCRFFNKISKFFAKKAGCTKKINTFAVRYETNIDLHNLITTKFKRMNMKKLILSLLLVASVTTVFAQSRNVTRANNLSRAETPNFPEARTLITSALQDPSTKNLANTWFVAGMVNYREFKSIESRAHLEAMRAGREVQLDQDRVGPMIMESLNFLIVADSLDQLPDDRGRIRPNARNRREVQRIITEYHQFNLIPYALHLVQREDYTTALTVLNAFLAVPDLPAIEGTIERDAHFYDVMFFTARVASASGNPQEAIRLFQTVRRDGLGAGLSEETIIETYQFLYMEFNNLDDTENYVRMLKEGSERFPQEPWFIQNLINHYINLGQSETALMYLEIAIQREPDMAEYRRVEGSLHAQLGNMEKAETAFRRALAIDPDLVTALDIVGRLYIDRARAYEDQAFTPRISVAERRTAEENRDNALRQALPMFQRLVELEPDVLGHKFMLRNVLHGLRMHAESEAITRQINAIMGEE